MYQRKEYLEQLLKHKDNEFLKVITGVRRSGKSYLLKLYKEYLLTHGMNKANIFFISFELFSNKKFRDPDALYQYIEENYDRSTKTYFFFDEIQLLTNWQEVVNSLRIDFHSDIYITGSNANLLSGELATLLSGRYVQISMWPLSFKEYLQFTQSKKTVEERFFDYVQEGGFPAVAMQNDNDVKQSILSGIFDTIIFKDIAARAKISNIEVLVRVVEFLMDNIGQPISANNIANSLKSDGLATTSSTVDKMLKNLEEAFIFYKTQRYDLRGKERLKTLGKYYVVDTGLRNHRLVKTFRDNLGSQIENIVFLELKRRGYHVMVGKYDQKEIDFVAIKQNEMEYIQVTRQLPENTHEEDNLLMIRDNYKKKIITANRMDVGNIHGIEVQYITDFLLEPVNDL
jgi:predicted AAA+ superfamily ATPase